MLLRQLALLSQSTAISFSDLTRVAAALSKQVARDFAPIWDIQATVDAFHTLTDVPLGYWPIVIKDTIGYSAAGIHLDKNNQPFALVSSRQDWSLTASHEALEMLADPFGSRTIAGDSPMSNQGRVEFLVEVSDPSEAAAFGYTVNSILVSDFYTPNYFDPVRATGIRYSFTGAITEPRQVLRGGYLSWRDPVSDIWWQETFFSGSKPSFRKLGRLSAKGTSLRAQIDRFTSQQSLEAMFVEEEGSQELIISRSDVQSMASRAEESSAARAESLQAEIDQLTGQGNAPMRAQAEPESEPTLRRARGITRGPAESAQESPTSEEGPRVRRSRGRSARDD
jgi:hypothetical protein